MTSQGPQLAAPPHDGLEQSVAEAELRASVAELEASRVRAIRTADAERRRIEQDLHDGAQQHLVAMRAHLNLAAAAIPSDPERGAAMVSAIGQQMDEALLEIRNLARGVYPALLPERGLGAALKSASRRSPWPASLEIVEIGRYAPDTETAVYFCCIEALQNTAKHAGPAARGAIRLWENRERLHFLVSDDGIGFTPKAVRPGQGLVNMRDRIESIGGALRITSRGGCGTEVRGSVPKTSRTTR